MNKPQDLHVVATLLAQLELATGLEEGKIEFEAQMESAEGFTNIDSIARATPRRAALRPRRLRGEPTDAAK